MNITPTPQSELDRLFPPGTCEHSMLLAKACYPCQIARLQGLLDFKHKEYSQIYDRWQAEKERMDKRIRDLAEGLELLIPVANKYIKFTNNIDQCQKWITIAENLLGGKEE